VIALLAAALLQAPAPSTAPAATPFFDSDSVMAVTIRTDLRTLLRDRDPNVDVWREGSIVWSAGDSTRAARVRLRTRGLYRLRECDFPPIRLRFAQEESRGTPWENLRRPKLVTHCMNNAEYEQNLLQEYAIYRVLRLLTPLSFTARLVRVTWEDSLGNVRPVTRYGIVTEDPERFAERVGGALVPDSGVTFAMLNPANIALVGVFQYFIANTDWSVPGRHNIELLRTSDGLHAIPYDFDWAGVINARYARPAAILPIRSVRERIFRGYCRSGTALEPVLARFESLRDSIAAVYRSVPDLDPRIVERTLRYHDEFFRTISDRERFTRRVVAPDCLG